ncbi:MAG: hypothetical protein UW44_C0021G0009 [Candidatus Collierbacteria bacterium GW2011_GWB2_44_22]|uniref:Uncharacterized protein n=1 Tax=Candidatus Collierbacteria bacterium GW2011_GWB2_44_22 TaxID=1618387 RepID=A0A0G1HWD9_9BACT|nr:MAG: hypothetical protein UW31_C0002G0082 [Candidatus Collierbacteria bacterium GW2011_GWA2_44_13]KKT50963.1 MAG: hypothetical protein UW44_C0021G0009 [Candidatus Collierbacteria bacterium GW2011_GWB2_44_22]KKT62090.1 MAG: hypothetical protein UW56_C0012G0029 [Candidatus Collierbacteria bacterium GW2011_GWD1_44_27]KKT64799.1 MAG: hypothetical protein UW58_C0036G0009 [Candidatus Collierbacteria bacterium GW2011_GWC2_44_30]
MAPVRMSLNVHTTEESKMTDEAVKKMLTIVTALMGIPTAIVVAQDFVALGGTTFWGWAVLITFWGSTFSWWQNKFQKEAAPFMVGLFFCGLIGVCLIGFAWVAAVVFLLILMAAVTKDKVLK